MPKTKTRTLKASPSTAPMLYEPISMRLGVFLS